MKKFSEYYKINEGLRINTEYLSMSGTQNIQDVNGELTNLKQLLYKYLGNYDFTQNVIQEITSTQSELENWQKDNVRKVDADGWEWIPLWENATVQSRMEQIYDDIEQAINIQLPIQYKDGESTKTAIPTEILPGPSGEPWSNIKFNNGDIIKDYEVIGLLNEANNIRDILPRMINISNNSPITQQTANRINEKFEGSEFVDFKTWLRLIESHIQTIKNNNKKRW